ncbi:hypothetical protein GCM10011408_15920 [Dyella caseinilytica]|nr:hypothetical protein GCM10011408_15920 [Dyella caseinilytica]
MGGVGTLELGEGDDGVGDGVGVDDEVDLTLLFPPPPPHALNPSARQINTATSRRRQASIPVAMTLTPICDVGPHNMSDYRHSRAVSKL